MPIYKTAKGWQVKLMRNGHRYTDFIRGHENYQEAVTKEAKALAEFAQGNKPEAIRGRVGGSVTLSAAFDRTFKDRWVHETKGTQKNMIVIERDWYLFFKPTTPIDAIDKSALMAYVSFLKAKGNRPKTINNKLSALSTLLKHMQDLGKIEHIPNFKWESIVRNNRVRWFTLKEEQALYDIALSRNPLEHEVNVLLRDFISLLFDTGMRPWMEAHNLQKKWIKQDDEGTTFIRVPAAFSKTNTAREIPATDRVKALLKKYSEGIGPDERVFRNLTQTYCKRYWLNHVKPKMGWGNDEVMYCMRHTFATRLVEKGVDSRVIQELMGHSTISQTARYAKVTKGAKASSIALLNQ